MGSKRIGMHRLQEAIRLHRLGRSRRAIAGQLRIGRNTIREYFKAISKTGHLDGEPDELPAANILRVIIEEHVPSKEAPQQTSSVEKWKDKIDELRLEKGAGPTSIHDYLRLHESDYHGTLSAIKRMCLRLEQERGPKATDVAIPVITEPGEVAQVDFAYAGKCYDPRRGTTRKCWLFVMTLGFSRRMFCELVFDQKIETWLSLHVAAFEYLGGVPRVIVPENVPRNIFRVLLPAVLCA
jgi:transposase